MKLSYAGTVIVTTLLYWSTALMYVLLDYIQWPGFVMKYKVQPGKNSPPEDKKVVKVGIIVKGKCTQVYKV